MSRLMTPLGALPLFFEERAHGRNPLDGSQPPVTHYNPLDHDPAQLLAPRRGGGLDRVRELQHPRPIGVEGPDAIPVRKLSEGRPGRVPSSLVVGVAQITPRVLLLELLEARLQPGALAPRRGRAPWSGGK